MASTSIIQGQIIDFIDTVTVPATAVTVIFEPSVSLLNDTVNDEVIILNESWVGVDADGTFSAELIATDDPNINPKNWTYLVRIAVEGKIYSKRERIKPFSINAPAGSILNLADIIPVDTSPGIITIQGPPGAHLDREYPIYWNTDAGQWGSRPNPLPSGFDRAVFKSFWDEGASNPSTLMLTGDLWWRKV